MVIFHVAHPAGAEKPRELWVSTEQGRRKYILQLDGTYAIDPRTLPGNPKVKLIAHKIDKKKSSFSHAG